MGCLIITCVFKFVHSLPFYQMRRLKSFSRDGVHRKNQITKLCIVSSILLLIIQYVDAKDLFSHSYYLHFEWERRDKIKIDKCNNPVSPDKISVALWLSYILGVSEFNKLHSTRPKLPTISTTTHNFVQRRETFNPTVRTHGLNLISFLYNSFLYNQNQFIHLHFEYSFVCPEMDPRSSLRKGTYVVLNIYLIYFI